MVCQLYMYIAISNLFCLISLSCIRKADGLEEAVEKAEEETESGVRQILGGYTGRTDQAGSAQVQGHRRHRDTRERCDRTDVQNE